MCKYAGGAITFFAVVAVATSAVAQESRYALDNYDPADPGSEWFAADSLDLRGHGRPAIGVLGDWAYRPLVVEDANGKVVDSIVRNQVFLHVDVSMTFWERLRFGLEMPLQVDADGHAGTLNGVTYVPPASAQALGDLRIALDARLFGQYGGAITGALGAEVFLPTGDRASYAGDGTARAAPRFLVAGDLGPFVYAARLGVTIRGLDESFGSSGIGDDAFFGASAGLRVADGALVIGPEIFARSVFVRSQFFKADSTSVEGMIGAHYTVARSWRFGAAISAGLSPGYGVPVDRGLLSIAWTPDVAPEDRDADGIVDDQDACPDVAGLPSDDARKNGCPAPSDRDQDGIVDDQDACPDVAGVKTEDPKTNGCPPPADRDKDGVLDKDDACPDVAGIATEDPKTNGCPSDRDKDGVLDKDDACPDVPGLSTQDPKTNGCPDPDRDKDGIPNERDACPDEAGKPDPDPKKNGCPTAFVQSGQIKIINQVKFQTGSARILPGRDSEEVLQAVQSVLEAHPEIKKVRVEGYTDNRGADAMNKKLSAARAASVVTWLSKHGVDTARLESIGFGVDSPIDVNDTEEGRANNRRVEFHIEP